MAFLGAVALFSATSVAAGIPCWVLDVGNNIPIMELSPEDQNRPICLTLEPIPNVPSVNVEFLHQQFNPDEKLCINMMQGTDGSFSPTEPTCSYGEVRIPVYPRATGPKQNFMFQIVKPLPYMLYVQATASDEGAPTPPGPVPSGRCPSPPPKDRESSCHNELINALGVCGNSPTFPAACRNMCAEEELECLIKHQDDLEELQCRSALRTWQECSLGPHLLLPMEIASVMLLATASFTLLCTVLRCCCRRLRGATSRTSAPSLSLEEPFELSDVEEDEETPPAGGTGAAAAAGGAAAQGRRSGRGRESIKKPPEAAEAEHDDELPAYTQVVEGGALTVQPLYAPPPQPQQPPPPAE